MPTPAASVEEFDWIKIKQEIGSKELHTEGGLEKLKRKTLENPFVPIGALLTTACLSYGLWTMRTGERRMSQLMMRGRVIAQAATLVALCGGVAMNAMKQAEKQDVPPPAPQTDKPGTSLAKGK